MILARLLPNEFNVVEGKPGLSVPVRVGCAGWALPKEPAGTFPVEGTHLARYPGRVPAVELDSSFYRPHKPATYARWAQSVPEDFRFAVKVPKEATHTRRSADTGDVLDRFLPEVAALGGKLGPLLVQLPPGLSFSSEVAETFSPPCGSGSTAKSPSNPGTRVGSGPRPSGW